MTKHTLELNLATWLPTSCVKNKKTKHTLNMREKKCFKYTSPYYIDNMYEVQSVFGLTFCILEPKIQETSSIGDREAAVGRAQKICAQVKK